MCCGVSLLIVDSCSPRTALHPSQIFLPSWVTEDLCPSQPTSTPCAWRKPPTADWHAALFPVSPVPVCPVRVQDGPSSRQFSTWREKPHLYSRPRQLDGFSTYFERWFCFTHQWNIEVIEFCGPYFSSQFNYLFVFYWERKYGCQVYGGKKADPVLSVLASASA